MHRFLLRFLPLLLLIAAMVRAGEVRLTYSVVPPATAVGPGGVLQVQVAALNGTTEEALPAWPGAVAGALIIDGRREPVVVRWGAGPTPVAVLAGGFQLRTLEVALPPRWSGSAILEIEAGAAGILRAGIVVTAPSSPASSPAEVSQRPTTSLVRVKPAAARLRRVFADRLAPHEPIYFIYGPDDPTAKFQFSFKYKLLDFRDVGEQRMARTLHFGFTQRSLWDIAGVSSPFYDTSYMPELIYESLAPAPEQRDTWVTWLGFQVALKHESNGRDGPMSRSLNTVYGRSAVAFGDLDSWHLLVAPEVFAYVSSLEDNPDLKDYRGYGRLTLLLGKNDGPSVSVTTWAGKKLNHGSVQVDLTLPIRTQLLNFETYFLIQYFNGYGESLRSYREHSETVRAGFSLVR
ncbi:phospholipase A [Opitutus sp. ER46]|uniref:phospholipase A n=1 Tax=Opitutus sp. ER46 TaxID=2161864 RepID=UPI001304D28F|nr:phospholipase A [Opitutus sp. ER46]